MLYNIYRKGGDLMKNGMLTVEEVATVIGKSVATINAWYRFARKNPESELAISLPIPVQDNIRSPRYWEKNDVYTLIEIQSKIPLGRKGPMGKYQGKGTGKNGEEKTYQKRKRVNAGTVK